MCILSLLFKMGNKQQVNNRRLSQKVSSELYEENLFYDLGGYTLTNVRQLYLMITILLAALNA